MLHSEHPNRLHRLQIKFLYFLQFPLLWFVQSRLMVLATIVYTLEYQMQN